jgi:tRNA modification GTPase
MIITGDTIAAVATPPGEGGVGMVRLSGPQSLAVSRRVFHPLPPLVRPRQMHLGRVVDPSSGAPLDDGFLVYMRAPRSYTCEDVVEMHTHGSPRLLTRLMDLLVGLGVRRAGPGEFTLRAFLNGRLDLTQAEALQDFISAESGAALEAARDQMHGAFRAAVEALREELVGLLGQAEVDLDFVDEDVPLFRRGDLLERAEALRARVAGLAGTWEAGRALKRGFRVVLAGRTNTGKSSLFNLLVGSERVLVHHEPGTTRDYVEVRLEVGGLPLVLVDTAGFRAAPEVVESAGLERSREQWGTADLVLLVLDRSRPPEAEDLDLAAALEGRPLIAVLNKADLEPAPGWGDLAFLKGAPWLEVSALTGAGQATLEERLATLLARHAQAPGPDALVVLRERHHVALQAAHTGLTTAIQEVRAGSPLEIAAVPLYEALAALDSLLGRGNPEAVLERVFAEFCIGK